MPIDLLLPAIRDALSSGSRLVLEAAPGAGKTTRVPPALLDLVPGEVVVLEPRRIAARLAARRVAEELGERLGETVGYQVRFEEVTGPRTRLRFVTEGVLTRRLLTDPTLRGVSAVVLDEFHERHLDGDLALALLDRLSLSRPDLKLLVMSATLDAAPVAAFLNAPVLRSEGRAFPLAIEHMPYSADPLEVQVRRAADRLFAEEPDGGHLLAFLPGVAEIRRAERACAELSRRHNLVLAPLFGDLSPAEQDLAVAPSARRKLILATNVAESSVTIDGVTAVIDAGLARIAAHSPWSGLETLEITRISQASARQRAGRAGRTAPGRVLRLYPEEDLRQRPTHDAPAILREDLSRLLLALRARPEPLGMAGLRWLDPPPEAAVLYAETLLDRLNAHGEDARRMASLPVPPRVARMLLDTARRGVLEQGCAAAAILASRSRSRGSDADLLATLDRPLDPGASEVLRQLRRIAFRELPHAPSTPSGTAADHALLQAVLSGFGDRVARRRTGRQVLLAGGGSAELSSDPAFEWMTVLEAEDRRERPLPLVRLTARLDPSWLLDLFPDLVRLEETVSWNQAAERVEQVSAMLYGALVIDETRDARPAPAPAAKLLLEKALETGIERFADPEALGNLLERARFAGLAEHLGDPPGGVILAQLCEEIAHDPDTATSFAELRRRGLTELVPRLEASLPQATLRELAPPTLKLAGGRTVRVHYEHGRTPWIESRLQDFFGMRESPRLGRERTPVLIHLLAPNHRAVQTTTDLAGFWERLYPTVRRELMRRYPRHAWPEQPR